MGRGRAGNHGARVGTANDKKKDRLLQTRGGGVAALLQTQPPVSRVWQGRHRRGRGCLAGQTPESGVWRGRRELRAARMMYEVWGVDSGVRGVKLSLQQMKSLGYWAARMFHAPRDAVTLAPQARCGRAL